MTSQNESKQFYEIGLVLFIFLLLPSTHKPILGISNRNFVSRENTAAYFTTLFQGKTEQLISKNEKNNSKP